MRDHTPVRSHCVEHRIATEANQQEPPQARKCASFHGICIMTLFGGLVNRQLLQLLDLDTLPLQAEVVTHAIV